MCRAAQSVRRQLALLGVGIVLATGAVAVVAHRSVTATVAQSSLPLLVGLLLVAYSRYADDVAPDDARWPVLVWAGVGLLVFFTVGFWFGTVSRLFDTSLPLALVASLGTGAAFGAVVGVYAVRLRSANADLTDKTDRLERFAAVVSHDLRNPLTVASGRLEVLQDRYDDEDLDDEVGDREPADVGWLAERAWETVETGDATLVVASTSELRGDPDQLRQLLGNLFRNAVEHAGEGVTVTVGALDGEPGFYVGDDGPGIPPADREQVFDQGYSSKSGGTGFGLTIVETVAAAHGWKVSVTESESGGARFAFRGVETVA